MAVGALEPRFFAALVGILEIDDPPPQADRRRWPEMREAFERAFKSRTQDEWVERFAGSDGCVAPVRSLVEAPADPHLDERGTFIGIAGVVQPAPAPRFGRTPADMPSEPCLPGQHTGEVLISLGYKPVEISKLRSDGAVG
jgi:alpha-methylacyl-CoA racemase